MAFCVQFAAENLLVQHQQHAEILDASSRMLSSHPTSWTSSFHGALDEMATVTRGHYDKTSGQVTCQASQVAGPLAGPIAGSGQVRSRAGLG